MGSLNGRGGVFVSPAIAILIARLIHGAIRKKEPDVFLYPVIPKISSIRNPVLNEIRKNAAMSPVKGALIGGAASLPFALSDLLDGKIGRGLVVDPAVGAALGGSIALNLTLIDRLRELGLIKALNEVVFKR